MSSSNPLAAAKATLAGAKRAFPSAQTTPAAPAKTAAPAAKAAPTLTDELKSKQDNVMEYKNTLPKMHTGGVVPGKEGQEVPIMAKAGETVIPAGRKSEYRQVYDKRAAAKKQTRQGGGNTPVVGEKHDQPKA